MLIVFKNEKQKTLTPETSGLQGFLIKSEIANHK
jgi:hypothetical protein